MLRALRLSDDKSVQEYADALGISRQQLSDIERGERIVSEEKAALFLPCKLKHLGSELYPPGDRGPPGAAGSQIPG